MACANAEENDAIYLPLNHEYKIRSTPVDPLPPECPPDLRASLVNAMTAIEAGILTPDQLAQRLWEVVRERVMCDG